MKERARCGNCRRRLWVDDPACICGSGRADGWKQAWLWARLHPVHRGLAILFLWFCIFNPVKNLIVSVPGAEGFRPTGHAAVMTWFFLSWIPVLFVAHWLRMSRLPTKGQMIQAAFEFGWNAAIIALVILVLVYFAS